MRRCWEVASVLSAVGDPWGWAQGRRGLREGGGGALVGVDGPEGVVGDFPQVPVGIGEVAGVAAPVGGVGGRDQAATLLQGGVDVVRGVYVDGQRNRAEAGRRR